MAFPVRIRFRVRAAESKQFEHCFEQWVNQLVQELGIQVIAVDGKNLRVPMSESLALRLHFVSAWATEHRLVLAQSKVQDKSMKYSHPCLTGIA